MDSGVALWRDARRLIPAGIIFFCAVAFYFTTQFDRVPPILKRGIQPSDFPQLVIGLIVFLCVCLLFAKADDAPAKLNPMVWKSIALMGGFVALVQVDLFVALAVFACSLAFLWGERRPVVLASLGAALPVAVFFLFDAVFKIRFPRGVVTGLWYG